jgi:predicted acyl esterase
VPPGGLPFSPVLKAWTAAAAVVLALAGASGAAPATTFSKQDLTLPMDDGAKIAATLYRPVGAPPAGGWPALVFMHGLAGNRQQMNTLVEAAGFAGQDYVVLTFDARGHGESTGLVTIDGPREVADVRSIEAWLADRSDVAADEIGAWGISYGGGAALNSLVAGVPWAAVATVETWTDLYSALVPQGLLKSGLVAGLAASIPDDRKSPELKEIQAAAFAGAKRAVLLKWTAPRSSLDRLGSVKTPVFMAQGRRDFLFGIDQGIRGFQALDGPKALYLGLHGHPPSTFPAADTPLLLTKTHAWFDCYLRHLACGAVPSRFTIVPETFRGKAVESASLPGTDTSTFGLPGRKTIVRSGRVARTTAKLKRAVEVFGSPTLRVTVTPRQGWSRLVAVLTARTPEGKEIVVSAGGIPLSGSRGRDAVIHMLSQVTFVPGGSRLTVTLGSSSTAQSPSNLLYLDLPMRAGASVRIGNASLTLPGLRTPVTR